MSATSPSEELSALAERLVILRKRTGMRQYEVAKVLRIRAATLSDFEGGRAEPKLFQAVAIADLYSVSLNVLIGRDPMPPISRWTQTDADE